MEPQHVPLQPRGQCFQICTEGGISASPAPSLQGGRAWEVSPRPRVPSRTQGGGELSAPRGRPGLGKSDCSPPGGGSGPRGRCLWGRLWAAGWPRDSSLGLAPTFFHVVTSAHGLWFFTQWRVCRPEPAAPPLRAPGEPRALPANQKGGPHLWAPSTGPPLAERALPIICPTIYRISIYHLP